MTEAEMLAALTLVSDSDSNDDVGGGSILAPADATEQQVNLVRLQDGIPMYLWRRSISFLTVCEQAVSVCGMSRFFRECSNVYMQNFWSEPILHLPEDTRSLARAMEMCQYLMEQEGYVEGTTVVVALGSGVYEVVGSWESPWSDTYQKTLSVPFDNLSFVGKGERETTIHGCFVVMNGRKLHVAGLTIKNSTWAGNSGFGLGAFEAGTKMDLLNVTVGECQYHGLDAQNGAEIVATGCQFHQNGWNGVYVSGTTTTARFTNCTFHHNKSNGVFAQSGAVVDLMGEGTSMHDNERDGLCAEDRVTTVNVYQPCVLNDMSHGNKGQNIRRVYRNYVYGGTIQQKDSTK